VKIARACTPDGTVTGHLDGNELTDDVGNQYTIGEDASFLPPCEPSALYCIGRNFGEKIDQMDYDRPDRPDFFIKPPTSLASPNTDITYPSFTDELTYAGELAAVIGVQCKNLNEDEVEDALLGYTILNDMDALDQERRTARKAFDGSGPLGPWIETDLDPGAIDMETTISGETRQEANTRQMLFHPKELVSFLSERFTFQPGDVISFGSPENPGTVSPGDDINIWYEGIGTLTNTIVE
jgi:2-keto-4-pentenoate hydratase/2-oxohepta-3-ene-1,7-dioic acid hydratase in catechol pathway